MTFALLGYLDRLCHRAATNVFPEEVVIDFWS